MINFQQNFRFGDAVWAKMKGFSTWPGMIDNPSTDIKRPITQKVMHCVFFFGTHNYAWIADTDIKPYQEFKEKLNTKKSASFLGAVAEIEEYIKTGKWTASAAAPSKSAADASEGGPVETPDAEAKSPERAAMASPMAMTISPAVVEDRKTKLRVAIAKLKVTVQELNDEMDAAAEKQEFLKAADVKSSIDARIKEREELESVLNTSGGDVKKMEAALKAISNSAANSKARVD